MSKYIFENTWATDDPDSTWMSVKLSITSGGNSIEIASAKLKGTDVYFFLKNSMDVVPVTDVQLLDDYFKDLTFTDAFLSIRRYAKAHGIDSVRSFNEDQCLEGAVLSIDFYPEGDSPPEDGVSDRSNCDREDDEESDYVKLATRIIEGGKREPKSHCLSSSWDRVFKYLDNQEKAVLIEQIIDAMSSDLFDKIDMHMVEVGMGNVDHDIDGDIVLGIKGGVD